MDNLDQVDFGAIGTKLAVDTDADDVHVGYVDAGCEGADIVNKDKGDADKDGLDLGIHIKPAILS